MSSNPFYQATGTPAPLSRGISYTIASEYQLVQAGFDGVNTVEIANAATAAAATALKGNITTQAWLGTHNFTGASSVLVPTPTLINQAVTKAYADGLAFATALPAQAGNAGLFVTTNGTTAAWKTILQFTPFGDGSDGNVTVTGALTLTRDMFYNNLTLNSACAINTAGYRIFVAGTLDISAAPAGAIYWNGSNGGNGANATISSGGAAGTRGTASTTTNLGAGTLGGVGIAGFFGQGNGNPGTAGTTGANGGSTLVAGTGGNAGSTYTGGAAGAAPAASTYVAYAWPSVPLGISLTAVTYTIPIAGAGAPSGGAGAGAGNANYHNSGGSGAGGNGGNTIVILANIIYRGANATAGIIQAKGGNAGTPGTSYTGTFTTYGAGGTAGSSGGAGGLIAIVVGVLTGSTIVGALDVSGGLASAGANGTTATANGFGGTGGSSGGTGIVLIYNLTTGTVTLTPTVAGTAGSAASGITGGAAGAGNIKQVNL